MVGLGVCGDGMRLRKYDGKSPGGLFCLERENLVKFRVGKGIIRLLVTRARVTNTCNHAESRKEIFTMSSVMFMFGSILNLVLVGISLYAFILFIKLANRGIKALEIYINEKSNNS